MPATDETMNQDTRQARCGHAICNCTVPAGQRFCGEHCEQQARQGGSRLEGSHCGCAHAPCDETAG